jgi:hypothetical protein
MALFIVRYQHEDSRLAVLDWRDGSTGKEVPPAINLHSIADSFAAI